MRGRRVLIALAIALALLLLAVGLFAVYVSLLARPNPVLAGERQLTSADLPAGLEAASRNELRSKLDQLLVESLPENMPEAWWSTRLSLEQCEDARRLALYLDDHLAAVRSLLWLTHKLQTDRRGALALIYLHIAQTEAEEYSLDDEYAHALLAEGDCLDHAGLSEYAISRFEEAHESFLAQDNSRQAIYALNRAASYNFNRLSRFDTAATQYERCVELAEASSEEPARVLPVISLWGFDLQSAGRYEDAAAVFQRATECAEKTGKTARVQQCLNTQAGNELCLGHNAEAETLLKQAAALNGDFPDDVFDRYESACALAEYYQSVGRTGDAVQVLEQALADIDLRRGAAQVAQNAKRTVARLDDAEFGALTAFGTVMYDSRQFDKAVDYYERAAALSDQAGAVFPTERVDLLLAQAYMQLGRYDDALSRLKTAEQNSWTSFSPLMSNRDAWLMLLEGQVYNELGEIELARLYIKRAAKACPPVYSVGNAVLYAAIQRAFGDLATLEDMRPEALSYYQDSYDVLSDVASGFQWTTPLRYSLDQVFSEIGLALADRLKQAGRVEEADEVLDRCHAVQLAHEYLVAGMPAPDDHARRLLNDYRTATTRLDSLRSARLQLEGSFAAKKTWPYSAYTAMSAYPWRYRREYVRQFTSLRRELKQKIAQAETDADACRQRLREGAPDIADIVDLKPVGMWWREEDQTK